MEEKYNFSLKLIMQNKALIIYIICDKIKAKKSQGGQISGYH